MTLSYAALLSIGNREEASRLEVERDEMERRLNPVRRKLAETIHDAWSNQPFDETKDIEDWAAADAVLAAFPQLNR